MRENHLQQASEYATIITVGEMAEWSIAAVLKTVEGQPSQGSNPCLSAKFIHKVSIAVYAPSLQLLKHATPIGQIMKNIGHPEPERSEGTGSPDGRVMSCRTRHDTPLWDSKLAIAPMVDWTTVPFRVLMRILAPNALLYTEMHSTDAILHQPIRTLQSHHSESPVALQVGGHDKHALAECCRLAEENNFAEVNLNLGCPSSRVQAGRFGVRLMREPELVSTCIRTMKAATSLPITAKIRIGIDHEDSYDFFIHFARMLIESGCDKIIVHARKAWLHGLNPKQNRTIPPLHYHYVYHLKQECPHLPVIINGNIKTIDETLSHLKEVDGVMIGRLACNMPHAIADIHHAIYPNIPVILRSEALRHYFRFAQEAFAHGTQRSFLLKPILNMAHALPNARSWKQNLLAMNPFENPKQMTSLVNHLEDLCQSPLLT